MASSRPRRCGRAASVSPRRTSGEAPTGSACKCRTTRSRATWRTCRRSFRTRASSPPPSSFASELSTGRLALLDRRQRLEVCLHAADELVVVRRYHAQLRLPLLTLTLTPRVRPCETLEPGPLRGNDDADADRE